ncbi:PCNA-interacting partner isoform X6 [Pteronotus mesoamericanus]|uniref:PCNA-interacting partner isoform X6 n=1 Tax=Pteronotus mesoamericanus TaxID=1884717 RepID=UPI0023EBE27A|nr:PCNA-interacting partner isoform X6 [Pteronotus parnellii mesoamericanus]
MAVLHQESVLAMIKEFRRNWHTLCASERTTLCGADAMLLVLQLSMAENNKQSQLRDFLSGRQSAVDDETDLCVPPSPVSEHWSQDNEKVKFLAKKIIYSYLNLLVNSKDDLALAHILNVPDRGLGREAFTDLKHAAQEKQMSIFLVATSFVRTIQLGGKGYAPSPSDPLRTHIKGLSNFINFIDKLDEILGEISNPSIAGGRILSVIKMQLIKGQDSRDPFYKAVEEVAQDLDLRIKNIINSQEGDEAVSTTDISPARPKSYAINHGTAYCGRDTVKILLVLLDEEAASAPTKNKAELLYDDENTIHHNGNSILTLFRSPIQVNNSLVKPLRERLHRSMEEKKIKMKQTLIRSQFSCTYKDDCLISRNTWNNVNSASKPSCVLHMENDLSEGVNSSVGRPTIGTSSGNVHLDRSKNEKVERKSSSQTGNKSSKRKQVDLDDENILCDNGNEPPQHKNVKIPKTSNDLQNKLHGKPARVAKSNKCTAKDKLITGQTKLTQFFRL